MCSSAALGGVAIQVTSVCQRSAALGLSGPSLMTVIVGSVAPMTRATG